MGDNSLITQRQLQTDLENFYNTKVYPYLNGSAKLGFTPIGTVISVMSNEAPENYLVCNGTAYNISEYSDLANFFEDQFGSKNYFGGDGTTTFAVPDLRGEFLRGTGTNSHANNGNGAGVGVHQNATQHVGVTPFGGERSFAVAEVNDISGVNPDSVIVGNNYRRKYTYSSSSDLNQPNYYTARPTNTSVLYCIAYKNIYFEQRHDYSTEEKVVGTWIDGKPLYEKTFSFSPAISLQPNSWADTVVSRTNLNINTLINCEAIDTTSSSGAYLPFPVRLAFINGSLNALQTRDAIQNLGYLTIQYTKTTD